VHRAGRGPAARDLERAGCARARADQRGRLCGSLDGHLHRRFGRGRRPAANRGTGSDRVEPSRCGWGDRRRLGRRVGSRLGGRGRLGIEGRRDIRVRNRRFLAGRPGIDGRHRVRCGRRFDTGGRVGSGPWVDRRRRVDARRGIDRRIDRRCRVHHGRGIGRRPRIDGTRRQHAERVEVPLRVGGRADAEVDVRLREIRVDGGTDRSDDRSFVDERSARHPDRPEMEQGHRRGERRLDRDRLAAARNGACEGDDALGRREDGRADRSRDVDAAMLAARIWMGAVEVEAAHDLTVHRPGPGAGGRSRERERA
jgi:hypothetical protein